MSTNNPRFVRVVSVAGLLGFILGFLPLVLLISRKTALRYVDLGGLLVFALGVITLVLLIVRARQKKAFWILVAVELLLLAGILIETFTDQRLYTGTHIQVNR